MAFKITGPGRYRRRDGKIETLAMCEHGNYAWIRGGSDSNSVWSWAEDGKYDIQSGEDELDIVARIDEHTMQVGETYEDMQGRTVHCLFERNDGTFACTGQDACGADLPERAFYYECDGTICGHGGSSDRSVRWPEQPFVVNCQGYYRNRQGDKMWVEHVWVTSGCMPCSVGWSDGDCYEIATWRKNGMRNVSIESTDDLVARWDDK